MRLPILLAAASLTTLPIARAQDAPPVDEPTLTIDAVGGDDEDAIKLIEESELDVPGGDVAPAAPGGAPPPPTGVGLNGQNQRDLPASLKAMNEEQRQKLNSLLQDASTFLGGIRVQEAFEKIVEAEAMAPDFAPVYNLKGAAYTKVRDFEKAGIAFAKALELDPTAFMSRFNLTEIHFVSGNFAGAEKSFVEMLKMNPAMPEGTRALIEFKILICRLKLGNPAGAEEVLQKFDRLDDHPGFYFGHAAIEFHNENEDKAKAWIAAAGKCYPPSQIDVYTDSFIEVGWIENLQ